MLSNCWLATNKFMFDVVLSSHHFLYVIVIFYMLYTNFRVLLKSTPKLVYTPFMPAQCLPNALMCILYTSHIHVYMFLKHIQWCTRKNVINNDLSIQNLYHERPICYLCFFWPCGCQKEYIHRLCLLNVCPMHWCVFCIQATFMFICSWNIFSDVQERML
jgi:hypothetical protein